MGDLIDDLRLINQALDRRFPAGRNPFQMVTRLAEECATRCCARCRLRPNYDSEQELEDVIAVSIRRARAEGLIDPPH